MANGDDLDTVIRVSDGLEDILRPIGNFFGAKVTDKLGDDIAGPVLAIPRKIINVGPIVLRQLGQGPGDEPYDFILEAQQGLDLDPIPSPGGNAQTEVIVERDTGDAGDVPPASNPDTANTGVIDP